MKIPAQANYVLVYSIEEYDLLGHIIEGYIVQLTSLGNLSLVSQRIHINNADFYDKALDKSDYEALELLSECTPEFLTRQFSKTKRIRPKDFFSQKGTPELIDKVIRPHIDQRLAAVLVLIKGRPLYIKEGKNATAEEVEWSRNEASILFHLRRNQDDVHYFPTLKYADQRVDINRKNAFLLSAKPCLLVNNYQLYSFGRELDGNKLKPFLKKRFIRIPREREEDFLKTFIAPLFEEHSLYAKGYKVNNLRFYASPIIRINTLLDGKTGILLYFKYGPFVFPYHSTKKVSVQLEKTEEGYALNRIKRSLEWESQKLKTLLDLGLVIFKESELGLNNIDSEEKIIEWVTANKENLIRAGFEIEQNLSTVYNLESSEFELGFSDNLDWFDVECVVKLGGFDVPFKKLKRNIIDQNPRYLLPDGTVAIIPKEWFEKLQDLIDFTIENKGLKLRKGHSVLFEETLDKGLNPYFFGSEMVEEVELPETFKGSLRSYQQAGYDWLNFLYDHNLGGCLADDMGLGKTVQTLAFIQNITESAELREVSDLFSSSKRDSTSLLIVPTSLVHNWRNESAKFTPNLKIHVHLGQNRRNNTSIFENFDLIITTYGSARNDIDILKEFNFNVVVLDEAQMIKNPNSKISQAVTELNCHSLISLTGTPVENSIMDLWSQMNITNPGLLGGQRFFTNRFVKPIEKGKDEEQLNKLRKIIHPFVLRRTKSQVAKDLPKKTEQIVYCEMTELQSSLYEQIKSQYRNILLNELEPKELANLKFNLLSGLTKLRLIANATSLYDQSEPNESGKFDLVLDKLNTALLEGHKVLIFSQFVKHLDLFSSHFDKEGIPFARIDGTMKSIDRQSEVEKFQGDESVQVFLLSLKAGGFGLNLTAADYVFILDPWWNPAAENQAIDRTHRIGQTKSVFSYRFISLSTIEEKILSLQDYKRQLSDSLIKPEESVFKSLNQDDLLELFS